MRLVYICVSAELKKLLKSKIFTISTILYFMFMFLVFFQRLYNKNSGICLNKIVMGDLISSVIFIANFLLMLFFGAVIGCCFGNFEFHNNTFHIAHLSYGRLKQHIWKIISIIITIVEIFLISVFLVLIFSLFRYKDIVWQISFKIIANQLFITILNAFEISLFSYLISLFIKRLYISITIMVLFYIFWQRILEKLAIVFSFVNYVINDWFTSINAFLIYQAFSHLSSSNFIVIEQNAISKAIIPSYKGMLMLSLGYLIAFVILIGIYANYISEYK